jgi:mRNA interferase MazF
VPQQPRRAIHQGDIYWVNPSEPEPRIPHPHVVIQDNDLNHSHTVAACALTSNIKRVSLPGNVLLDAGEANLPRPSVVEVAKVSTLDKAQLGDYIGTLSARRIEQILAGIRFIQTSFLSKNEADS